MTSPGAAWLLGPMVPAYCPLVEVKPSQPWGRDARTSIGFPVAQSVPARCVSQRVLLLAPRRRDVQRQRVDGRAEPAAEDRTGDTRKSESTQ